MSFASVAINRGFKQIVDVPHYARFECRPDGPSFSVYLVSAPASNDGVVIYFECEDVDNEVERLRSEGIELEAEPVDQSWLWREAYLRDPDGNRICILPGWREPTQSPLASRLNLEKADIARAGRN